MVERVDFHSHYSPENVNTVVDRAKSNNVVALGLISKLTIPEEYVIRKATTRGLEQGVDVLMGVEISKPISGDYVDLIALGFDTSRKNIRQLFGKEERRQRSINVSIHQEKVLREEGFEIEPQNNHEAAILEGMRLGEIVQKAFNYCEMVVGNPNNEGLVDNVIQTNAELWQRIQQNYINGEYRNNPKRQVAKLLWHVYFEPGKKGHVPSPDTAKVIIREVHSGGGVVLISPEGKNGDTFNYQQYRDFLAMGGDGIMAWHGGRLGEEPDKKFRIDKQVILQTRKMGKLVLGGSDFDPKRDHWQVGIGDGNLYMSPRRYNELRNYLDRMAAPA